MRRALVFAACLALFAVACAMPEWPKTFRTTYKIKGGSELFKANCTVCHTLPVNGKLNPYGQDLLKAMKDLKVKSVTPDALKRIEQLDSDKDGKKNIDEIKRDTLPGKKE